MRTFFLVVIALTIIGSVAGYMGFQHLIHAPHSSSEHTLIEIPQGTSVRAIAQMLHDEELIPHPLLFVIYQRLQGNVLKSGEYLIPPHSSLVTQTSIITAGVPYQRRFTISEGSTFRDIVQRVEQNPLLDAQRFQQLVEKKVEDSNIVSTPEGLLFPETYSYSRSSAEQQLVRAMSNRTYQVLQRYQRPGWSPGDILILASIIEKEAGNIEEMPLISSVFHNRLQRNMRLQADPTVWYGLSDDQKPTDRLRRRHLDTDTPYNTYTRHGLPPTPICSPSEAAIASAANPAQSNYLYFVASPEHRGHVFSKTLTEHNYHVQRYWDAMSQ
ncbi:endolytic transglycosylase MltG [Desulfurispira natronophila]|uniref:Endolytic murein transglycosylase n=1 Tax=Desulfurispira natronophila TaxID=682562 RepID=A0A7W7Y4X8_9BACT|nr:endolytic transglycosylase MltG [Desulfurispira natronophila]MBB5022084.1 UPF0755 protein [Desulfurispira natronophila]